MAWTSYTGTTPDTGVLAQGYTTMRWGTNEVVSAYGGTAITGAGAQSPTGVGLNILVVTRINERTLVENIKLPNGSGVTTTRIQVVDGAQWDVTVRDDTGLTTMPRVGTSVRIVDMAGLLGTLGLRYYATVCESGYDTAPKQAGERTLTVEKLALIESAGA